MHATDVSMKPQCPAPLLTPSLYSLPAPPPPQSRRSQWSHSSALWPKLRISQITGLLPARLGSPDASLTPQTRSSCDAYETPGNHEEVRSTWNNQNSRQQYHSSTYLGHSIFTQWRLVMSGFLGMNKMQPCRYYPSPCGAYRPSWFVQQVLTEQQLGTGTKLQHVHPQNSTVVGHSVESQTTTRESNVAYMKFEKCVQYFNHFMNVIAYFLSYYNMGTECKWSPKPHAFPKC